MLDYQIYNSLIHSVTLVHFSPKMLINEYVSVHLCGNIQEIHCINTGAHTAIQLPF